MQSARGLVFFGAALQGTVPSTFVCVCAVAVVHATVVISIVRNSAVIFLSLSHLNYNWLAGKSVEDVRYPTNGSQIATPTMPASDNISQARSEVIVSDEKTIPNPINSGIYARESMNPRFLCTQTLQLEQLKEGAIDGVTSALQRGMDDFLQLGHLYTIFSLGEPYNSNAIISPE